MKTRLTHIFITLSLSLLVGGAHIAAQDNGPLRPLENLPKERVFVHYNTPLLFTGEYLFFKVYSLDTKAQQLSKLSKVAYVTMVNPQGEEVFTQKINLVDGQGQGDYFMSTSIPTGQYKLLGYTQWMKNEGLKAFFQDDVNVINPYQSTQVEYLTEANLEVEATSGETMVKQGNLGTGNFSKLKLNLNKSNFGVREGVKLKVEGADEMSGGGTYSLSVRKVDSVNDLYRKTAQDFWPMMRSGGANGSKVLRYIPELRGNLVSGRVLDGPDGNPVPETRVALSIPGDDYTFMVAKTNASGQFFFNLHQAYDNEQGLLQVIDQNSAEGLFIEVANELPVDYSKLKFDKEFKISAALEQHILNRSVYNQIENAFFSVKPDTVRAPAERPPFYGSDAATYNLDDYTRFKTTDEVFVEIVNDVWVGKDDQDKAMFRVRETDLTNDSKLSPLVLVDGIFLKNHQELLDYDARKISSVTVVRDTYFMGSAVFQGIIDVKTEDNHFYSIFSNDQARNIQLIKPQQTKNYFKQTYAANSNGNVPDFRSQLLWQPNLDLSKSDEIKFYTSDNAGTYEVCLEGFTADGKPVSLRTSFRVN